MISFNLPWHIAFLYFLASVYWAEPQTSKQHRIHPDHKPWCIHLSSGSSRLPQALLWELASFINCRIYQNHVQEVMETLTACFRSWAKTISIPNDLYISFLTSRAQVLCRRRLPDRTAWMSSLRFLVAMKTKEQSFSIWGMTFTTPGIVLKMNIQLRKATMALQCWQKDFTEWPWSTLKSLCLSILRRGNAQRFRALKCPERCLVHPGGFLLYSRY